MTDLTYFFLPAILLLGLFASWGDIRKGKISNKLIYLSLIYFLLAYLLMVLYLVFSGSNINIFYLRDVVLNLVIASGFSFLLYSARFWAPGDGKLFIAFSALIPLSSYSKFYISYFPSAVFFSNTFIIAALFLALYSLFFMRKNLVGIRKAVDIKKLPEKLLFIILSIFSFSLVISRILGRFFPDGVYLTLIAYSCSILLNMLFSSMIRSRKFLLLAYLSISLFNLVFFRAYSSIIPILSFSLSFAFLKTLLIDIYGKTSVSKKAISGLSAYSQIMQPLFHNRKQIAAKGEILSREKAQKLKSIFRGKEVLAKENASLAPFLFLGALITILIKGEIISWIMGLF